MATRLEEILIRARDTLSDPNAERWSQARLVRLADDAQKLIALHANSLKSKVDIPLAAGVAEYSVPQVQPGVIAVWTAAGIPIYVDAPFPPVEYALPANLHSITRVINENGDTIPFMSHEQADRHFGMDWETEQSSPVQAVIFDKIDQNRIKIYPIPAEDTPTEISADIATLNSIYGVTVAGGLESTYDFFDSPYGVMIGVAQRTNTSFTLYYVRSPFSLVDVTSELEISSVFDQALKFYIAGMALLDDNDAQSRARGNEELGFFRVELRQAQKDSAKNGSAQGKLYEVPYIGGFDN